MCNVCALNINCVSMVARNMSVCKCVVVPGLCMYNLIIWIILKMQMYLLDILWSLGLLMQTAEDCKDLCAL